MPRTIHDRGEGAALGPPSFITRARVEGRSRPLAPLLCGVGLRSLEPRARKKGRFVTAMMRAAVAAWPDSGGYLLAARELVDHPCDPPTTLHVHLAAPPNCGSKDGRYGGNRGGDADGQVFIGRRTRLRARSASQVFAGSRTVSEDKDAGHGPGGSSRVGHAFKIGVRAKARRRVRFPSASAAESGLRPVTLPRAA